MRTHYREYVVLISAPCLKLIAYAESKGSAHIKQLKYKQLNTLEDKHTKFFSLKTSLTLAQNKTLS